MSSWNSQIARLFAEQKRALEAFVTRRTGSAQVAADLTQESFLRLARLDSGDKIDNLPAFLFTIASNLVRDHQRQAIRRERLDAGEPSDELPCSNPGADEQLAAYQQEQLMQAAILALPEATRQIFLLYHVDELSYREIGERLSISPRSVEYQLRRALIECRGYIKTQLACDEQGRRS
ncbi:Sigma factor, ECF subfamily [Pseudomonas synxantha]|uniref:RNA polymerase sigma factor n=1 Tax=Pseudomonas synxantha TaxID=47883 RepID=UPI000F5632F3|nr:RNA polymerase sigma factor [Pseudomonas synxantha]AZE75502.1 Sigma factor, ECF subfamily [Pseudomonas synxantha]AZE81129.1 Sigma factor, ECF subfamily [Pseudomonas synxantha]